MIFSGDPDILYPPESPSTFGALSALVTDDQIREFMTALYSQYWQVPTRAPVISKAMADYQVSFADIVRATGTPLDALLIKVGLAQPQQQTSFVLTVPVALKLAYEAMTTGASSAELSKYGGYDAVMQVARAGGMTDSNQWIMQYEIDHGLRASLHTEINTGNAAQVELNVIAYRAALAAQNAAIAAQAAADLEAKRLAQAKLADQAAALAATEAAAASAAAAKKAADSVAMALVAQNKIKVIETDLLLTNQQIAAKEKAAKIIFEKSQADLLTAKLAKAKADEASANAGGASTLNFTTIALAAAAFYLFGG